MQPEDPRHGTVAGYNRIPCREDCCRTAYANYRKRLEWDKANGRSRIIPTLGVRRRLQALNRLGWSNSAIAAHAGMHDSNLTRLLRSDTMTRGLRARLVATYEALCMQLPTGSAQSISFVRRRAERNGWPPPLAWDDVDDPNERPASDPGRKTYANAELLAEWEHFTWAGESTERIAQRLGVTVDALEKARERSRKGDAA